jgi:chloramphenicol 3-O phosphotransferase
VADPTQVSDGARDCPERSNHPPAPGTCSRVIGAGIYWAPWPRRRSSCTAPQARGKSSIARALQASAPVPAFHISLDAFVTMSNRRDMRSDAERAQVYGIHCENLRSTLARVVQTHFDIILDLVLLDESQMDACLNVLRGRPTYVVRVWAPLDVLEERERSRHDPAPGMAREQVDHPAYRRAYDLQLDTSLCTPEEGALSVRRLIGCGAAA